MSLTDQQARYLAMARKRPTLTEVLDRVGIESGQVHTEFWASAAKLEKAATGFRDQVASVQKRQDHHLRIYLNFVRAQNMLPQDTPDDELRLRGFPEGFQELYTLLREQVTSISCKYLPGLACS